MKYILFAEAPPARGKLGAGTEVTEKKVEIRKDEKKFGKVILEPHFYATGKLVLILEIDNLQQLANRMALGVPDLIYTAHPLINGDDWGKAMREHGDRR
jgi:hypothetical protein